MGSPEAKRLWRERAAAMEIDMLRPQHGAVYQGADVRAFHQLVFGVASGFRVDMKQRNGDFTLFPRATSLPLISECWFPSSRDCESIIKKRVKVLFTTKARSTRRKIIAFIQCIENFVLFVPSW